MSLDGSGSDIGENPLSLTNYDQIFQVGRTELTSFETSQEGWGVETALVNPQTQLYGVQEGEGSGRRENKKTTTLLSRRRTRNGRVSDKGPLGEDEVLQGSRRATGVLLWTLLTVKDVLDCVVSVNDRQDKEEDGEEDGVG